MEETKKSVVEQKTSSFWKGVRAEFSKIIWPTKEVLTRQTIAVVTITIITSAIIALIDRGLQYGINFVIR